jgi:hypothetical protein
MTSHPWTWVESHELAERRDDALALSVVESADVRDIADAIWPFAGRHEVVVTLMVVL